MGRASEPQDDVGIRLLLVSGGGTHGEGVQIWDIRNLEGPVSKLTFSPGEVRNPKIEPLINAVRFIPFTRQIIVSASDDTYPAKIFNYQSGELIEKFLNTKTNRATACDASARDGSLITVGDAKGTNLIISREKLTRKK